jgi:hypothetical protein
MGIEGNGDAFLMQRGPEMALIYVRDLTGASLPKECPLFYSTKGIGTC